MERRGTGNPWETSERASGALKRHSHKGRRGPGNPWETGVRASGADRAFARRVTGARTPLEAGESVSGAFVKTFTVRAGDNEDCFI